MCSFRSTNRFWIYEVGTPRCGVPGRVQRAELLLTAMFNDAGCAAERGADSAARCPYPFGSNRRIDGNDSIPSKCRFCDEQTVAVPPEVTEHMKKLALLLSIASIVGL